MSSPSTEPFIADVLPLCQRMFSAAFMANVCGALGNSRSSVPSSVADILRNGSEWSISLFRAIESELFDPYHFIGIHSGADASATHPQGCGVVDPLTLLVFPKLPHADVFPSAPMPVGNVPMSDITAIGQRYQHALGALESSYGHGEARHFRDHFFPKCQGEPVFELGYALDAKNHIASTIMEQVTKQRLALCVPSESDLWQYFNYSFLRSFGSELITSATHYLMTCDVIRGSGSAVPSDVCPTLGEISSHADLMRSMLKARQGRAEGMLLSALEQRPPSMSELWLSTVFVPIARECARIVVSCNLLLVQLALMDELIDSVPNTEELLRLLGATSPSSMSHSLFSPSPASGLRTSLRRDASFHSLTPCVYQV